MIVPSLTFIYWTWKLNGATDAALKSMDKHIYIDPPGTRDVNKTKK